MASEVERNFAIPKARISVIPNPVTIDREPVPLPADHAAWFDRPVLVTAGRLEPQKDQAKLIEAFARSDLAATARLLILGVGKLEGKLKAAAARLGVGESVVFAGYTPDVRPYLEHAKGFVLSSTHESFGLVLLEAMACGLPIAAFDCPTGPRALLDHGRFGRLLTPDDVSGMANAMSDLVAGRLTAQPRQRVDQHLARYAPERIADMYASRVERWLDWAQEDARSREGLSSSPYRPAYSPRSTAS